MKPREILKELKYCEPSSKFNWKEGREEEISKALSDLRKFVEGKKIRFSVIEGTQGTSKRIYYNQALDDIIKELK